MINNFNDQKNSVKDKKNKGRVKISPLMKQAIERIRQFKSEKKLKNEDIVKLTGISKGPLSEILKFKRSIPMNFLIKLHEKYNLSCDYILFDIKKPPVLSLTLADFVHLRGSGLNEEDFVTVPLISGKIAATIGSGIIVDEYVEDWAVIHKKVIGRKKSLISIRVDKRDGDSMKPILGPGDIVIIDRDDRMEIKSMAIYAVRIDDGCTIKRLDRDNQHLLLISENKDPIYKTTIIDLEQVSENPVIGRVIWCSKGL